MRYLYAILAVLVLSFVAWQVRAQGTDTLVCWSAPLDYPEGELPDSFSLTLNCLTENTPPPEPDPEPDPDPPPPAGNLQAILDMPAGSWLAYGDPWSDLEASGALDRNLDNCGVGLSSILGAWNGILWDGNYLRIWATGGHGDGCWNGALVYDLEAGQPEVVMPHTPLNVPYALNFTAQASEPYVADTPWVCDPENPAHDCAAGRTLELWGTQIRPRASHIYNNAVRLGDWVYLPTGSIYSTGKKDWQVWRYNVTDPAGTLERLPDRPTNGSTNINWVLRSGLPPLVFDEGRVCQPDMVAGDWNCTTSGLTLSAAKAVVTWDEERQGIWVLDTQYDRLGFATEQPDGRWAWDESLSVVDVRLDKNLTGAPGLCLVPTISGSNPVVYGANGVLLRWDGVAMTEVTGQTNQPPGANAILNKWVWNDDLGVCLGTFNWNRGIEAWRPDFSSWEQAELPPPDPEPAPGTWPTFAGHTVAPLSYPLPAWDEPTQLQPEAPDVAALCPGPWAELNYSSDADLAGSRLEVKDIVNAGTPNVRVYVAGGTYTGRVDLTFSQCGEVIGMGERAVIGDKVVPGTVGIIVRGIEGQVGWSGTVATNTYLQLLVIHDSIVPLTRGVWGVSDPNAPLTYVEFVNSTFGPDTGWHVVYLERSIGKLVARGNVFHGSGNAGHALKNLAHQSWIEGNVFSNVGIDGQVLAQSGNGNDIIGLFPLDAYACTETVIRNNTFVFRTSNNTRTFYSYRGRRAWGNCDKGARQPDERWAFLSPQSLEYQDPAVWSAIEAAIPAFDQGLAAARAEPWLFAHLSEGNTFIAFNAHGGADDTRAAEVNSLRPVAKNPLREALIAEATALSQTCEEEIDSTACWLAGASPGLTYAYNHISPGAQGDAVRAGKLPRGVPIPHPEGWQERAGVFWGSQSYITCDATGQDCAVTGDRLVNAAPLPWDALEVARPPRLLPTTD